MGLGLNASRVQAALKGNWHMPDEGDKHQRAFIAFGAQQAIWEDFTPNVQDALGLIARTLAEFEPVTVFCREGEQDLAAEKCGTDNITFVTTQLDDIWMRDIGANFVIDGEGRLGAVDFNFNGWATSSSMAMMRSWRLWLPVKQRPATSAASWWARVGGSKWMARAPLS